MPTGVSMIAVGWLNDDGPDFILRLDGGGRWRLDVGLLVAWRARKLLGKRVEVRGVRDGFDVIGVSSIQAL